MDTGSQFDLSPIARHRRYIVGDWIDSRSWYVHRYEEPSVDYLLYIRLYLHHWGRREWYVFCVVWTTQHQFIDHGYRISRRFRMLCLWLLRRSKPFPSPQQVTSSHYQ